MNGDKRIYGGDCGAPTEAASERNIGTEQFAEELELALRDYFQGEIERQGKTVNIKFPNGQTFKLTVE